MFIKSDIVRISSAGRFRIVVVDGIEFILLSATVLCAFALPNDVMLKAFSLVALERKAFVKAG